MSKIFKIFMLPVYILSKIIPKDNSLIVIGSSKGYEFSDNSKYLYLYLLNKQNNKKIIWISRNKQIVTMIKNNGYNAEYYTSLKGLYFTIRAKVIVISHHLEDVNRYLTGGAKVVQLWHGNPIRKIGYDGDWNDRDIVGQIKKIIYTKLPFLYYMMCDVLIVTSTKMADFYKKPFKYSFRHGYNVKVLGYPRLDALNNEYKFNKSIFPEITELNKLRTEYRTIVSWLPTHRSVLNKTIIDLIEESKMDSTKLNDTFRELEVLFVIKPHFLDLHILKEKFKDFKNILVYDKSDPYPLLHHTDILITDYSSVFLDFLIKDKSLLFLPIDYEEYKNYIDFYYNYSDFVPGKICNDWNDIINNISLIIANGDDSFGEKRNQMKRDFFQYDFNNSKRIFSYISGIK